MPSATIGLVGLCGLLLVACGSSSSGGGGPGDGAVLDVQQNGSVDCNRNCVGVMSAGCPNGPVDQADCVQGCQTILSSPCASNFQTLMVCAGAFPQYACDSNGAVTITGCESQYDAMIACLSGGP